MNKELNKVKEQFNHLAENYRNEIFLSAIIVILAGFTVGQAVTPQDSQEDETVTIVTSELVGFEPMSYAISHHKVPEPEGINVKLKTASMTQAELHTMSTNQPTVGILSNVRVGIAQNNGREFEVMAPWYREGMGEDNMTVGQLVTSKDSSVKELEDLYGREVGVQGQNGGSTLALKTALRAKGLNLSRINFVGVQEETGPLLVKNNEIAAAMFDSNYIVREDFDEDYRTVIDFGKVLHEEYGAVPPSQFVVVRKDHYEEDPEKYEKTVQWLRDNYEWARNNKEQISRVRAQETGRDYDTLMRKFSYFERIGNFTEYDVAVFEDYYQVAKETGAIEKVPDLDKLFEGALERDYSA